mmetsp:Transcript_28726/g.58465  ORF Transcript_28726/g.58465 Transcript_28726/m.58465 type:complete len:102 (+) Transcript_28726:29-334(+)
MLGTFMLASGLPQWRLNLKEECPTCPGGQFYAAHSGNPTGYGGISPTEETIPCGQVDHTGAYYVPPGLDKKHCLMGQQHHSVYHFDDLSPQHKPLRWDGGK